METNNVLRCTYKPLVIAIVSRDFLDGWAAVGWGVIQMGLMINKNAGHAKKPKSPSSHI